MSKFNQQKIEQIELILNDYKSELGAIDLEINQEKEVILKAINNEKAEIESLLEQYRQVKRRQELDSLNSHYQHLTKLKENLLLKIEAASNSVEKSEPSQGTAIEQPSSTAEDKDPETERVSGEENDFVEPPSTAAEDGDPETERVSGEDDFIEPELVAIEQSSKIQPNDLIESKVEEFIKFIEGQSAQELVKLYPADLSDLLSEFDSDDTLVRDRLLHHYQQQDINIYQALLKIYQKPDIFESIDIPHIERLSDRERKYHEFLQSNYPQSLPFFWFLIHREADSIRYVVMEFAVDHIISTNTLDNDPHRRDLSFKLPELLEMNNGVSTASFLRDLFLCFHPQRIGKSNNTRNKYFDYLNRTILTQSTLQHSDVLQLWNYMNKSGYLAVADPQFDPVLVLEEQNGHDRTLAPNSEDLL